MHRKIRHCGTVVVLFLVSAGFSSAAAEEASEIRTGSNSNHLRICAVLGSHWANEGLLDRIADEGWAWGVEIWPSATDEAVRQLRDRGWQVIVDMHANPDTRRRQREYLDRGQTDTIADVQRLHDVLGSDLIWQMYLEDDSAGVAFPQELIRAHPRTHAEARALFDAYLDKAVNEARAVPDVVKWGVCGYASGAHPMAAHGIDCIIVERVNDDVEDLQTAIAFGRGAARQHGIDWGIDLSGWWGPIFGVVFDMPASLYKRHLYVSYMSGTMTFRMEGADLLYPEDGRTSTYVADMVTEFYRNALEIGPVDPDVCAAVVLPVDHGWMTPPYWRTTNESWNYARIPYRPGDRGIDGFFTTAFPGSTFAMDAFPFGQYERNAPPASPFALSCVTPRFAPTPDDVYEAPAPVPFGRFKTRDEARERLKGDSIDPAPYRPMGDSRWGDLFDVVTADVSTDVLSEYPLVILCGPVTLDVELEARLRSYVDNGGTLVLAAGVAGPAHADLCGVELVPELHVARAWQWQAGEPVHEPCRYLPAERPIPGDTEIAAATPGGEPLVVKRSLGKGTVWTCLVPWYEAAESSLCGVARRMLDEVIEPIAPVRVEGLPVQWNSARQGDDRLVLISNNDKNDWQGSAVLRNVGADVRSCHELLTGSKVKLSRSGDHVTISASVPAYDVRIYRFGNED